MDSSLVVPLPAWIDDVVASFPSSPIGNDERMALVIALSRENVERGGGPFGAAVFLGARLIAAGVNRVLESGLSIAHAEILALSLSPAKDRHQRGRSLRIGVAGHQYRAVLPVLRRDRLVGCHRAGVRRDHRRRRSGRFRRGAETGRLAGSPGGTRD